MIVRRLWVLIALLHRLKICIRDRHRDFLLGTGVGLGLRYDLWLLFLWRLMMPACGIDGFFITQRVLGTTTCMLGR